MKKSFLMRLILSVCFPLLSLHAYWRDLDGNYSGMQFLWGLVIAIIATVAIFLYVPVAKKVERGSVVWTFGLLFAIFVPAVVILGSMGETKIWGRAVSFFALWIPVIHISAQRWDKTYKWSFFKRVRPIEQEKDGVVG